MRHHRPLIVALVTLTLVVAACGRGEGELEVLDARSRMSPMLTGVGAVYLDVGNDSEVDDQLLGATVDPSVAARVELHETFDADAEDQGMGEDAEEADPMGEHDAMDDDGEMGHDAMAPSPEGFAMMGMREIEALDIPAGETVSLVPGGYHLMLLELADDLTPGETFELTLTFASAGEVTVNVEVREDV
ncbi:MAG: copper chaperone PCu(A)C [Nitriliruptor sp.]|nr:MAG: copper chaperone PCu(A)C [Nitriliruptor sp.]